VVRGVAQGAKRTEPPHGVSRYSCADTLWVGPVGWILRGLAAF
jgi:hypothetical protein